MMLDDANENAAEKDREERQEDKNLRARVVATFVERAKEVGVRAVSTDEMAKSLSISKKTLYKVFRSKEELVREVLNGWEERLREPLDKDGDPRTVVHAAVGRWYDNDAQFKPVFWKEVGDDYPALRKQYFDVMFDKMRDIGSHLTEYRRPGMSKEFGLQVYMLLMLSAPQPDFYEKAKMNRRDAVMSALDVWLDGVFDLPDRHRREPAPQAIQEDNIESE